MKRHMRIAILIDVFAGGGKERRCLQMLKGLKRRGITDLHIILIDNIIDYPDIYNEAKVHIIGRKNKFDIGVFYRIYKLLKDLKPDFIMTWTLMKFSLYICVIKPFIKCKYISAIVTAAQPIKKYSLSNLVKYISFKQADVIVGNSKAGITAYKAPQKKSQVIYNGFDYDRLQNIIPKSIILKQLNITTKYVISMAARINRHKDFQTYIDAAKMILTERQDITFLCIGKGELIEFYQKQLSEFEKKYILFLGFRKDVDSILSASDISVLCTNNKIHKEGVSNTILESMAYGVPVIATTGGGTDEIVLDNETGFIIPPFSPNTLKMKIEAILNDSILFLKMKEKSQARIKKNFSLDLMVENYIKLFSENA